MHRRKKLPMRRRSPRLWLSRKRRRLSHKRTRSNQQAGKKEKPPERRNQEATRATARAKGDKPAVQEQAADSISQKPAEAAPTVVPSSRANQPLNAESRNENLLPTAAAAWPIIPN